MTSPYTKKALDKKYGFDLADFEIEAFTASPYTRANHLTSALKDFSESNPTDFMDTELIDYMLQMMRLYRDLLIIQKQSLSQLTAQPPSKVLEHVPMRIAIDNSK